MQNQQIIVVVLGSTLKGIVAVKPNVCMECAGVRRGQAALGHAGSVASFSGCFQGLVGKAKQLTVSAASANLPAQEAARISDRDDSAFKRKVIRESLSLDTGLVEERPEQSLLALPEHAHNSGDGDQAKVVFLKDGEVFEWITINFS